MTRRSGDANGHRFSWHGIMIQLQSSWFPIVDLNTQTFWDIFKAKSSDFIKATYIIYHSSLYPSHIKLGVLSAK